MRIATCANCGNRFFASIEPQADFENVAVCPHCGNRDFAFRFFGTEAAGDSQGQFNFGPDFRRAIRETLGKLQYTEITTVVTNLSDQFGLATASVVFLLNELLKNGGLDGRDNPLRFVELVPEQVSVDALKAWLENHITEAPAPMAAAPTQAEAPQDDEYKAACEALQKENEKLRREQAYLLEALNKARADLAEYQ